jgi:hypothetical protein
LFRAFLFNVLWMSEMRDRQSRAKQPRDSNSAKAPAICIAMRLAGVVASMASVKLRDLAFGVPLRGTLRDL